MKVRQKKFRLKRKKEMRVVKRFIEKNDIE